MKKPTIKDIQFRLREIGVSDMTIAEEFYYFYESNGWKVGKNQMRNWKMALSGWIVRKKKAGQLKTEQQQVYKAPKKQDHVLDEGDIKKAYENMKRKAEAEAARIIQEQDIRQERT